MSEASVDLFGGVRVVELAQFVFVPSPARSSPTGAPT